MYLTIQALVLRITDYKERDALVTLLTRDHGRMTVKVRGLRRKNSPHTAACQLLTYSEFTLFEYQGRYTVNEAHAVEIFQGLRRDIQKLSLGTYFAQLAELLSQEDLPNPQLLSLVLNCLFALSGLSTPENKVKAVFELRAACLAGYYPDLTGCFHCGIVTASRFDVSAGMLECSTCRSEESHGIRLPVTSGVLDAMRYIVSCDAKRILSFDLPSPELDILSQLTETYLLTQLERGFSTLDFYKSLLIT